MKYISLIFVFLCFSCSQDIGNYNYKDINELTIEGVSDQKLIEAYAYEDDLKFTPIITGSKSGSDDSNLEYTWKLVPTGLNDKEEGKDYIIGREKNLDYHLSIPANTYHGIYEVKDKYTGNVYTKRFFVSVKRTLGTGWAILGENEKEEPSLDWIYGRSETVDAVLTGIWNGYEEDYKQKLGKPISIDYPFVMGSGEDYRLVNFEKGSYKLIDSTMQITEGMNMRYQMGRMPEQVYIRAYTPQTQRPTVNIFVDKDGELYKRLCAKGDVFDQPCNRLSAKEPKFRVAPFYTQNVWNGFSQQHGVMFYDQDNCRFVELRNANDYLTIATYTNSKDGIFEPTTNKEMIHMESRLDSRAIAILRDKTTGAYSVYGFTMNNLSSGKKTNTTQLLYNEMTGPDLDKATCFVYDKLNNYVFYSAGGKVYRFSITTAKGSELPAIEVIDLQGEEIVQLKYMKLKAFRPKPTWEVAQQNDLYVFSNKTTGVVDGVGCVRSYIVPTLEGKLTLKKDFSNKGLSKIIDATYFEAN